jgi:hypothetical protein
VVVAANQPPEWNASSFTYTGATATHAYSKWINWRASDPDGDPMTFAVVGDPGWVNVATNGQVTGTPTRYDAGTNTLTVSVQSGEHPAVEATMKIIVASVVADIDHWPFDDANGTQMSATENITGTTMFNKDSTGVETDGSGLLVFTQGSNEYHGESTELTMGSRTNGIYELEFLVDSFDLTGGDAGGANVGFGFREGASNSDIFFIRLNKTGSGVVVSTYIDGNYTTIDTLGGGVYSTTDPVRVRAEVDLDAGTADVYTTVGAASENFKATVNLTTNDVVWDVMVYKTVNNSTDWGASDYVKIDDLKVRKLDLDNYTLFEDSFDWQGETATADSDDPDGDGMDNFTEYALGGDPIVADAATILPKIIESGGAAYAEMKLGVDSIDLQYTLEHCSDITANDWTSIPSTDVHGISGETVQVELPDLPTCFSRLKIQGR